MARGGGDVVAVARIIAAQRPIGALDDALGAFDDPVERRTQHFVERVIEGRRARGGGGRRAPFDLHRAAKAREAAVGAGHDFAAEHDFAAFVGAAARMLAGEAAARGERADQRHLAGFVFFEPDDAGQRLAGNARPGRRPATRQGLATAR